MDNDKKIRLHLAGVILAGYLSKGGFPKEEIRPILQTLHDEAFEDYNSCEHELYLRLCKLDVEYLQSTSREKKNEYVERIFDVYQEARRLINSRKQITSELYTYY